MLLHCARRDAHPLRATVRIGLLNSNLDFGGAKCCLAADLYLEGISRELGDGRARAARRGSIERDRPTQHLHR